MPCHDDAFAKLVIVWVTSGYSFALCFGQYARQSGAAEIIQFRFYRIPSNGRCAADCVSHDGLHFELISSRVDISDISFHPFPAKRHIFQSLITKRDDFE
jgi:hypothetical protein